jgi:Domain of unknown function (DUF1835)
VAQHGVVHIINGSAAAGTAQRALGLTPAQDLLISHDLYSCGPLPPIASLADWRQSRETWWMSLLPRLGEQRGAEYLRWPGELLDHQEALKRCDSIWLWIGTGLGDQMLLVFLAHLLRRLSIPPSRLQVIQYDRIGPGSLGVVIGTGELDEGHFRSHPKPTPLTDSDIEAIDAAWSALTAPEPDALATFHSDHGQRLPFLLRALESLLLRYPDHRTGLGIWDWAALKYTVEKGPKATQIVGYMMAHGKDQPDHTGDAYLYGRLQTMGASASAHPLVSLSEPNKPMRETTVTITDAGRAVLNGEASAVELNGIDDWVSGVHLDSRAGRVWFYRDGELVAAG